MTHEDYKTVLYRQDEGFWVAEIPAIPGCYALMTSREDALTDWENLCLDCRRISAEGAGSARGYD
jgi:hypothetical protein